MFTYSYNHHTRYCISQFRLSYAAVEKSPQISEDYDNTRLLFIHMTCPWWGCITRDPGVRAASGWVVVVSGDERGEMVNHELVLKTSIQKRYMSLLPCIQWPKRVTWSLLTPMCQGGFSLFHGDISNHVAMPAISGWGSPILHQEEQHIF